MWSSSVGKAMWVQTDCSMSVGKDCSLQSQQRRQTVSQAISARVHPASQGMQLLLSCDIHQATPGILHPILLSSLSKETLKNQRQPGR